MQPQGFQLSNYWADVEPNFYKSELAASLKEPSEFES